LGLQVISFGALQPRSSLFLTIHCYLEIDRVSPSPWRQASGGYVTVRGLRCGAAADAVWQALLKSSNTPDRESSRPTPLTAGYSLAPSRRFSASVREGASDMGRRSGEMAFIPEGLNQRYLALLLNPRCCRARSFHMDSSHPPPANRRDGREIPGGADLLRALRHWEPTAPIRPDRLSAFSACHRSAQEATVVPSRRPQCSHSDISFACHRGTGGSVAYLRIDRRRRR